MESLHFKTVRSNRHAEEKNCVLHPAHKETCHKERGGGTIVPPSFFIIYVDYNARNVKSLGVNPRLFIFIRI